MVRPTQIRGARYGLAAGDKTNRRPPGVSPAVKRRMELRATDKVAMAKYMEQQRPRFGSEGAFWLTMVNRYSRTMAEMQKILAEKEVWQKFISDRKLGTGQETWHRAAGCRYWSQGDQGEVFPSQKQSSGSEG
jgi:asparagine synthetase B (glutamine-hydrolysing)